jgi:Spy/CpxP family protein refolding chaperone
MKSFGKFACFSVLALFLISQSALAQPGRGGGGFMGGFMNPSSLALLGDEKVQKELDLDETQLEKVKELQEEMQAEIREVFSGMRDRFSDGNREELMKEIRETMTEINKDFDGMIDKELLDHQKQRLKQLVFHAQVRRTGGASGGNLPEGLVKELNITDEQKTAMEEKAKAVREDLEKKISNLRKQAEEEVLSVLSKEQQDKYKELMGEPFEFTPPQFGMMGRGGGRGGDGGSRGGRGGEGRYRGGDGGRPGEGGSRGGDSDRDF